MAFFWPRTSYKRAKVDQNSFLSSQKGTIRFISRFMAKYINFENFEVSRV